MTNYARMYRFGITPWERYATAAAASISALLDREESERSRPSAVRSTSAAAVVPAAPTGLERHCPNLPRSGQRPTMPRTAHSCRIERVADKHASACRTNPGTGSDAGRSRAAWEQEPQM